MSFVSSEAVLVDGSTMWAAESSASVADGEGNLLFYTNGADLNSSTTPTHVLIIPWHEVNEKYILFHFTAPNVGSYNPPTGLNNRVLLNSANLAAGVFMLQLFDQEKTLAIERLIVTDR